MIHKMPIYVDLDKKREIVFNLNTEILICNAGGKGSAVLDTVGRRVNADTGVEEDVLQVNEQNLRLYLWAALQDEARRHNEALTMDDVGRLLTRKKMVTHAAVQLLLALSAYYGDDETGEASAPAISA